MQLVNCLIYDLEIWGFVNCLFNGWLYCLIGYLVNRWIVKLGFVDLGIVLN